MNSADLEGYKPVGAEIEACKDGLFELAQELGYVETPEMSLTRQRAIEAMTGQDHDITRQSMGEYQDMAMALTDSMEYSVSELARIGQEIVIATIYRDGGQPQRYRDALEDAAFSVRQEWQRTKNGTFKRIADKIETEIQAI
ncbi:MAG: hypothetical protein WCT32_00500 [Patescibacteria group bacterium]|jgi:hypothetical protein